MGKGTEQAGELLLTFPKRNHSNYINKKPHIFSSDAKISKKQKWHLGFPGCTWKAPSHSSPQGAPGELEKQQRNGNMKSKAENYSH